MSRKIGEGLVPMVTPFLVFTATGLAGLASDWNWAAISLFSGFVSMVPLLYGIDPPLRPYAVFLPPFVAYAILMAADYVFHFHYAYVIGLALFACAGFSLAFYAMYLLRQKGHPLTYRWIILLSVAAGWAATSFATFGVYFSMEALGEPIYNWQYDNTGLDNTAVNRNLMQPMAIGMPAVVIFAFAVRMFLSSRVRRDSIA